MLVNFINLHLTDLTNVGHPNDPRKHSAESWCSLLEVSIVANWKLVICRKTYLGQFN